MVDDDDDDDGGGVAPDVERVSILMYDTWRMTGVIYQLPNTARPTHQWKMETSFLQPAPFPRPSIHSNVHDNSWEGDRKKIDRKKDSSHVIYVRWDR